MKEQIAACLLDGKTIYAIQKELGLHSAPIIAVRDAINVVKSELINKISISEGSITRDALLLAVVSTDFNVSAVLDSLVNNSRFTTYDDYVNSFKPLEI